MLLACHDMRDRKANALRHSLINSAGLDPRIHNDQSVVDADYGREYEKGVFERKIKLAVGRIHKQIASRLKLGIYRVFLYVGCTCTTARYGIDFKSVFFKICF